MDTPDTTAPVTDEVTDAASTADTEAPQQESSNSEAARYRVRLREAEAERDLMRNRLTGALERIATTEAAKHFADPADFWSTTKLPDLLNESGNVDNDKLDAAIDAALEAKPHWKRPAPATESTSTVRSNDRVGEGAPSRTWSDVLQGKLQ